MQEAESDTNVPNTIQETDELDSPGRGEQVQENTSSWPASFHNGYGNN